MPKIDQDTIAEASERRWQCNGCGSIHHYLPADKQGCRTCGGHLIEFEQYKPNPRSKQNVKKSSR